MSAAGDTNPGLLGALIRIGPGLLIASIVLVTGAFALRHPPAAVPALLAGAVLYAGMYAQANLAVMYASIAVGYAAWIGLYLWLHTRRPAPRTARRLPTWELAGIRYDADDPRRSDVDLWRREITVRGKGGRARVVKVGHEAARAVDRYLRVRSRHEQAWRPQLWLGVNNRGPMTANGIYQMIARRGRQAGVDAWTHRFRHHFSHTWLDRGGAEGDLMELNGWSSPQMLRRYGASARSARARRTYDRIMEGSPSP